MREEVEKAMSSAESEGVEILFADDEDDLPAVEKKVSVPQTESVSRETISFKEDVKQEVIKENKEETPVKKRLLRQLRALKLTLMISKRLLLSESLRSSRTESSPGRLLMMKSWRNSLNQSRRSDCCSRSWCKRETAIMR